jgi:hypothetical protein
MGRAAHARGEAGCEPSTMARPELLFAIVCMIGLEINHLKWIVWEHWDCRRCGAKHKDCGHGARWLTLL